MVPNSTQTDGELTPFVNHYFFEGPGVLTCWTLQFWRPFFFRWGMPDCHKGRGHFWGSSCEQFFRGSPLKNYRMSTRKLTKGWLVQMYSLLKFRPYKIGDILLVDSGVVFTVVSILFVTWLDLKCEEGNSSFNTGQPPRHWKISLPKGAN